MASTPHMNPPSASPREEKDVPLPHMPPKPVAETAPSASSDTLPDTTKAEQEAGKAAVDQAKKRTQEEQAAGTKASEQASKKV
jgi:hypothetical protein